MARKFVRNVKSGSTKRMQQWAIEKPELDNARKLRGIHFVHPQDTDFKETVKNARQNLDGISYV